MGITARPLPRVRYLSSSRIVMSLGSTLHTAARATCRLNCKQAIPSPKVRPHSAIG